MSATEFTVAPFDGVWSETWDEVVSHAGLTFGTLVPRARLGLDRTLAVLSACAEYFAALGARR